MACFGEVASGLNVMSHAMQEPGLVSSPEGNSGNGCGELEGGGGRAEPGMADGHCSAEGGSEGTDCARPRLRKIPKLPMVQHNGRWYRARLLKDTAARVLVGAGPGFSPDCQLFGGSAASLPR